MKILVAMFCCCCLVACGGNRETRLDFQNICEGKVSATITMSQFGTDTILLHCDALKKPSV